MQHICECFFYSSSPSANFCMALLDQKRLQRSSNFKFWQLAKVTQVQIWWIWWLHIHQMKFVAILVINLKLYATMHYHSAEFINWSSSSVWHNLAHKRFYTEQIHDKPNNEFNNKKISIALTFEWLWCVFFWVSSCFSLAFRCCSLVILESQTYRPISHHQHIHERGAEIRTKMQIYRVELKRNASQNIDQNQTTKFAKHIQLCL